MATGGQKEVGWNLVKVGTLKLEVPLESSSCITISEYISMVTIPECTIPEYISIVVCQDKIVVIEKVAKKVQLFRFHDGKLLAMIDRPESSPRDLCLMDAMTVCVLHVYGLIEMVSIDSTDMSRVLKTTWSLHLQGVLDWYIGVVRFKDNLVVSGLKQGTMYWCIVSLYDGHVDTIHQICEGDGLWCRCDSRMTTKDNIIYISCDAGVNSGVYGFDILNPTQCKYTYKHQRLQMPKSIVVNKDGNIFVCNNGNGVIDSCIHQLTSSCQLVAIFTQGMLWFPGAMFWDNGRLYVTCRFDSYITVFQLVYQGSHKASEVLVSDERRQPVIEETAIQIGQDSVHKGQSSIVTDMPPSAPVPGDSEHDKQDPGIPVEILRMDDKSLKLYKEALQDGKEKVYSIRVMVVGQFGVGKTTLTKRLLGQQVDITERKSTEGIDVHKHCCKIALDTGEWIVQHEASDQLFRLQRLVKLLTGQTERHEGTGEQKGHTGVIYQRETTPKELHGPVHYSDDDDDALSEGEVIFLNDLSDSPESDIDKEVEANSVTIQNSGRHVTTHQEADITKKHPEGSSSVNADQRPLSMEMGGIAVHESKSLVTSKDDAMMEFLQLVNEKADKLEKSIIEYAALAMWDFAGQYVFYTTHQTFLTCRAIYLLVTDLSQQITDFVEDDECFFDTEGVKLCKVQDLVEVWMNSIHCCAPASIANTPVTSPAAAITMTTSFANTALISHGASNPATSTDVGISVTPPVILVGTHEDKIRQDKRREIIRKYFDQICFILKDKPAFQHLEDFFPIDNTQFDPQLETLKKRIFELASKQPYWGQEVPANWLPLESSLMKLKASGIKCFTKPAFVYLGADGHNHRLSSYNAEEFMQYVTRFQNKGYDICTVIPHSLVEEMNQAGAVPIKTTEQLDLFLRFQHETGNFIYFSVEGLREWLVLDPAWLIDALKSLITADTFIFKNNPAIQGKFFEFRDKGKLTAELIDAIWTKEKHPEFHYYKEIILQLMEKLNIVARPRLYSPDAKVKVEGYFLAPCMLRQATPKELISFGPNSQQGNTSVICYVFTGKFLPSPVFHRLLAACVAQWPIARKKMENLIFCGCCHFDLDLLHRLTVLFREHVIFAGVSRIGTTEKNPSSKLCIVVREFITRTLSSIIGCLGQSLQFELSIQCPNSDRYSVHCHIPVAILQGNVEVPCHFHDNSHVIISHDVLKIWFQEEEQSADSSSAVPVPPPPAGDTDRFMRLTYLLVDVGSRVLRQLLNHHTANPTCTLDQYLAKHKSTLNNLLKRKVLHQSQMDIMFPPNLGNTNLEDYDVTLLSALFNNVVPSLTQQEEDMIKNLREDRNKLYGHAKSCKMNAMEYQNCWKSISSTLITLSQQCGDPDFENVISQEIQQIQVSAIPTESYLDILKTWFSTVETFKGSLQTVQGSLESAEGAIQALRSRVDALEMKKTVEESERK